MTSPASFAVSITGDADMLADDIHAAEDVADEVKDKILKILKRNKIDVEDLFVDVYPVSKEPM